MFRILARGHQDPDVTVKLPNENGTITECDVSLDAVREFIALMWAKYQGLASKTEKACIIDAVVLALSMNRKAAIRLLNAEQVPELRRKSGSRTRVYSKDCEKLTIVLWHQMGRMSARRYKAALPDWLPHYSGAIPRELLNEVLRVSPSTVDRWIKPERARLSKALQSQTRPPKIETLVPLKPLGIVPQEPGILEIDTVHHCGGHASGTYAHTITATDIMSTWTVNKAILGRHAASVAKAIVEIIASLPFTVHMVCFDNGAEFINNEVLALIKQHFPKIEPVRGRAYHKNDQCYVEQKNFTSVRQLFGYERITGEKAVAMMNVIYEKVWNPLHNHYIPQEKTLNKVRLGSRYKRTFRKPMTPHDVLVDLTNLPE